MVRVGNSIDWSTDSGVGSEFGISDETTCGIDNEYTLGYYDGSFDGMNYGTSVGSLLENLLNERPDADMGDKDVVHETEE